MGKISIMIILLWHSQKGGGIYYHGIIPDYYSYTNFTKLYNNCENKIRHKLYTYKNTIVLNISDSKISVAWAWIIPQKLNAVKAIRAYITDWIRVMSEIHIYITT